VRDTLSYADAARLLGGERGRLVDWFERLTAVVPVPAVKHRQDGVAEDPEADS